MGVDSGDERRGVATGLRTRPRGAHFDLHRIGGLWPPLLETVPAVPAPRLDPAKVLSAVTQPELGGHGPVIALQKVGEAAKPQQARRSRNACKTQYDAPRGRRLYEHAATRAVLRIVDQRHADEAATQALVALPWVGDVAVKATRRRMAVG